MNQIPDKYREIFENDDENTKSDKYIYECNLQRKWSKKLYIMMVLKMRMMRI